MSLIESIERGINKKYQFVDPSLDEPIFYRAITRREHENAIQNAIKDCHNKKVIKLLFRWAHKYTLEELEFTKEDYIDLRMHQYRIMENIVHAGIKDFQPPNFSIDMIGESFINVRGLADEILRVSIAAKDEIVEVLKSTDGKILAYQTTILNVPLTDEAWKMTPAQLYFSIKIRNPTTKKKGVEITSDMIKKNPRKYKDELVRMFGTAD